MKCRKCGNEVEIGEVFCQKCGTAIQIVPDYNPLEDELENSLQQKTIAEFGVPHKDTMEEAAAAQANAVREQKRKKKKRKQLFIMAGVLVVFLTGIAAGVFLYLRYTEEHSFEYQYQQGLLYEARQEYGTAMDYYTKAIAYDKDNIEVKLSAAGVYEMLGNYDRALELLLEVANLSPTVEHYTKLMKLCEISGNTTLMNKILKDTQGTAIGEALSDYQTATITVSQPGGEYHDYLTLELTASDRKAVIYYTLDGTAPTTSSSQYSEAIKLETVGTITLRAVAYNEMNLAGEELRETYSIVLVTPEAPEITPGSGTYTYGEKISLEVQEGATAYFTIDGTIPTKENGYIYTESIVMPIGNVIFSAIVIDRYGTASNVVRKNYTCTIDRPFGYDAAVIKLRNYLIEVGMMVDLNGNRADGEKISVEFVSLTEVDGQECYVYTLRRTANGVTTTLNDKKYAVTTQNGEVHTLTQEVEGIYHFVVEETTQEIVE